MMLLLRDGASPLHKVLMICLLLVKGICTDSLDGAVLPNSTFALTTESPIIQTTGITDGDSTPGDLIISSETSSFPNLPTSVASVTENAEVDVTTETEPSIIKDSETTTRQQSVPTNDTISVQNSNISPLNELPADAATTASTKNRPLDATESYVTSTMGITEKVTTDSPELTTGHETEQTMRGHSMVVTTGENRSRMIQESGNISESTTGYPEITTNFGITLKLEEVTKDLVEQVTTSVAEVTPKLDEVTRGLAKQLTTNIAEISTNIEVTTNLAEITTNHVEYTSSLTETTTIFAETTTNLAETTTNLAETTTNLVESTTNHAPEATTVNIAELSIDSSTAMAPTSTMDTISTRTSASKKHLETNEIPATSWFILILDGNCTHLARGRQGQRENGLKRQIIENMTNWLDTSKEDLTIPTGVVCTPEGRVHANLTLFQSRGSANISNRLKSLEDMKGPLFRFHGQEFYVYQILTADGFFNKEPDIPVDLRHTDVELLIYISVGATCAFLFLLAMTLLACKYCSCRDPKPFEFGEPPNANLRLEDYTLTRIPRPKLGYVEYCRGLTKRYCPLDDRTGGMVRPFDTSVVPLEDVRTQDFRDGVIVRPSDIHRLGGSLGRVYHAGCCGGYVTDADGYCIHSTENLHRAHKVDRYVDKGVDNPNFY